MRLHQESLLLFRLRHLRETLGFSLCGLFEYYPVNILPQITLITQRNTTSCIISQRKTDSLRLRLCCCFGVCLRKSARSAGDIGVSFVRIAWVLLCEYSPADYADHAEECSKLHYFAEKDRLELGWFWGFVVCLRKSARSAGDIGVSIEVSCVKN